MLFMLYVFLFFFFFLGFKRDIKDLFCSDYFCVLKVDKEFNQFSSCLLIVLFHEDDYDKIVIDQIDFIDKFDKMICGLNFEGNQPKGSYIEDLDLSDFKDDEVKKEEEIENKKRNYFKHYNNFNIGEVFGHFLSTNYGGFSNIYSGQKFKDQFNGIYRHFMQYKEIGVIDIINFFIDFNVKEFEKSKNFDRLFTLMKVMNVGVKLNKLN